MNDEREEQAGGKPGPGTHAGSHSQGKEGGEWKEREERGGKEEFSRRVKVGAERKLRGRRSRNHEVETIWSGLGMIGLIGWGVSVPTLLGAALGIWLDGRFPGAHSWTLTLLFAGLFFGCLNAWRWIAREERLTRRKEEQAAHEGQEKGGKP